ncbi:MAG: hypothetical protein RIB98_17010 [Acidimicrobiales bacterium]
MEELRDLVVFLERAAQVPVMVDEVAVRSEFPLASQVAVALQFVDEFSPLGHQPSADLSEPLEIAGVESDVVEPTAPDHGALVARGAG